MISERSCDWGGMDILFKVFLLHVITIIVTIMYNYMQP